MILYGTNPIAWANDDDPSLGSFIPTQQILEEAAQIGFDGVENGHRWPQDDPEELRSFLGEYHLKFVSGWHSLNLRVNSIEQEKAIIQTQLDKLKHNGCAVAICCETSDSVQTLDVPANNKVVLSHEELKELGSKVEEIAQYCADQGITLVYHFHTGTVIETPAEIDAFMSGTGEATKMLFDAGHYYFGSNGQDPLLAMKKYAHKISHFHAKNVRDDVMRRVRDENLSFMDGVRAGVFTVPGDKEGAISFQPLLQVLKDADYTGWIVIEAEQDPAVHNPFEYQSLGLQTLKSIAAEVGLK